MSFTYITQILHVTCYKEYCFCQHVWSNRDRWRDRFSTYFPLDHGEKKVIMMMTLFIQL